MKNYQKPSDDLLKIVSDVCSKHHKTLHKEKVKIQSLLVYPGDENDGPALVHAGTPANAKIKIASGMERALLDCDVILQVAGDTWDEMDKRQKAALIDHELAHLFCRVDKDGITKRREDGDVCLGVQPDDFCINGFYSVIKRHGVAAVEAQAIKTLFDHDDINQLLLDFSGDQNASKSKLKLKKAASTTKTK